MFTPSPTQDEITAALRSFLIGILPAGTDVILAQVNRVPEPVAVDFVVMTPLRRRRLATNIAVSSDVVFTGFIAANVLTVTAVSMGTLTIGAPIFGTGVAAGTTITAFGTGSGLAGSYILSSSQSLSSRTLAAGVSLVTQKAEFAIQLDVHGPTSSENAATITTLVRDEYAVDAFAAINPAIVPLYADDAKQMPFNNAEQQFEDRWIVETLLQADQTITVPAQFASSISIDIIDVEATYPV